MTTQTDDNQWIRLGKISGLFGVKGWVKVYSDTEPRENILTYSPWYLAQAGEWQPYELLEGKAHGKGIVALLSNCLDRDAAAELVGREIAIKREQLPRPRRGEYYWNDLLGMRVINLESVELGKVTGFMETGANDVMVVTGSRNAGSESEQRASCERLIPFIREQVIREVDLENYVITVDWDADF